MGQPAVVSHVLLGHPLADQASKLDKTNANLGGFTRYEASD